MAMMVSDIVETQNLAEWKIDFIKRFVHHGKFERGEIAQLLRAIANDYEGITEKMVENFHYKEFKHGKVPQLEMLRQKFIEEAKAEKRKAAKSEEGTKPTDPQDTPMDEQQPKQELNQLEMTPDELKRLIELDPDKFTIKDGDYKKGRMVEVKVVDVREYGAIVETTDGFRARGLIHNSEIQAGEYVSNASKYFKIGDTLRALIIYWEEGKNRLRLSTRNLPMKELPYITATVNAIQPRSEEEQPGVTEQNVTRSTTTAPTAPAAPSDQGAVSNTVADAESQAIKGYLNSIVGALTPDAEEMMVRLIKEHGLFKFTVALMKARESFRPDLGVHFMKEIDLNIGEGL